MKLLILILTLLAIALVFFAKLKRREGSGIGDDACPFYAKKPLTQPE